MRIFLILHPSGNLSVSGSMTWYRNLYEPMLELGHDVFFLNLSEFCNQEKVKFRTKEFKKKISLFLPEIFKKENGKKTFDLFFSYLTDLDIELDSINEIKKTGIPTANFSCNNTHQFHLVKNLSPLFDFNLHSEKSAADKFIAINANPIWFQMAANPTYYKPEKVKRVYDASFIGMNYAKRAFYINHLLQNNIDVHCFGPKWTIEKQSIKKRKEIKRSLFILKGLLSISHKKRIQYSSWIADYDFSNYLIQQFKNNFNHPVSDCGMIEIFNKTKINLGFLEVYGTNNNTFAPLKQHLHLREFEIPMSGGLYCTNYSDELAEHYIPDKEVIVFSNEHELLDKVSYYLLHPKEAEKIRSAGLKRALADHTYQKRLINLFAILGS